MENITFPPGVVNIAAKAKRTGYWRETNLVRWNNGNMEPFGGWERLAFDAFDSPLRAIHQWQDNGGIEHTAYLCETNLYVETGGSLVEITPTGGIEAPTGDNGGYGDLLYS